MIIQLLVSRPASSFSRVTLAVIPVLSTMRHPNQPVGLAACQFLSRPKTLPIVVALTMVAGTLTPVSAHAADAVVVTQQADNETAQHNDADIIPATRSDIRQDIVRHRQQALKDNINASSLQSTPAKPSKIAPVASQDVMTGNKTNDTEISPTDIDSVQVIPTAADNTFTQTPNIPIELDPFAPIDLPLLESSTVTSPVSNEDSNLSVEDTLNDPIDIEEHINQTTTQAQRQDDLDGLTDTRLEQQLSDTIDKLANQSIVTRPTMPALEVSMPLTTNADITNTNIPDPSAEDPKILNPDVLPEYQQTDGNPDNPSVNQAIIDTSATEDYPRYPRPPEKFYERWYNKLFNNGMVQVKRLNVDFELEGELKNQALDLQAQPFNNIQSALENIDADSVNDFAAAQARLTSVAQDAAEAVGYFETQMTFEQTSYDDITVRMLALGERVIVDNRIIDVQGEAAKIDAVQDLAEYAPPLSGSVFNQGTYQQTASSIVTTMLDLGFFDGQWLNKSADIILPDNIADITLIYESGDRYRFGKTLFVSIDEQGQIITDPAQLPLTEKMLKQLISYDVKQPFDQHLLNQLTSSLLATQYFNRIDVQAVKPNLSMDKLKTMASESEEVLNQVDNQAQQDTISNPITNVDTEVNSTKDVPESTTETAELSDDVLIDAEVTPQDNVVDTSVIDIDSANSPIKLVTTRPQLSPKTDQEEQDNIITEGISDVADSVESLLDKIVNSRSKKHMSSISYNVVQPESEQVRQSKHIPVVVFLDGNNPNEASIGVGYGTDTGVRARGKLGRNRINRKGYNADVNVEVSEINKKVELRVGRPYSHPLNDILNATASYSQESRDNGSGNLDLNVETLETGVKRIIKRDSGWQHRFGLRYILDRLESELPSDRLDELPPPFNLSDAKLEQQALLLGYGLRRTDLYGGLNPYKGFSQFYKVEVGSEDLLTDANLAIVTAELGGLYSFGVDWRHQVVGKLQAGTIVTDDFVNVPFNLRFFAGGDQSLRGFDYKSLAPVNQNGYLVGGQHLAIASAEYNYEVIPKWRAAVFADVGNAYNDDFSNDTEVGTGVGVRWASPVGTVRLDVAGGVSRSSIPIRLHFFIGTTF